MKNVYVLATDKPSRLYTNHGQLHLDSIFQQSNGHVINQNIYITSDEEIKDGDWCYYLNIHGGGKIICQAYKHKDDARMLFDYGSCHREKGEGITPLKGECKKIILTTDEELQKDGVQAIDDNFLEWFVKNPSCEFVEVESGLYFYADGEDRRYKIFIPWEDWFSNNPKCKQIESCSNSLSKKCIYPQEEPKQDCTCGVCDYCEEQESIQILNEAKENAFKQKALEEAGKFAEIRYLERLDNFQKCDFKDGLIEGAKWQAERMYSEEEVLKILYDWTMYKVNLITSEELDSILPYDEWFKQNKKK